MTYPASSSVIADLGKQAASAALTFEAGDFVTKEEAIALLNLMRNRARRIVDEVDKLEEKYNSANFGGIK